MTVLARCRAEALAVHVGGDARRDRGGRQRGLGHHRGRRRRVRHHAVAVVRQDRQSAEQVESDRSALHRAPALPPGPGHLDALLLGVGSTGGRVETHGSHQGPTEPGGVRHEVRGADGCAHGAHLANLGAAPRPRLTPSGRNPTSTDRRRHV
ncbi:MAG: hypothetical protein AVDCRST_MAG60-2324 [uncultured Nocardioides sp.]|uniref:Uncharacterized protein n=1 Tax=uncultured Nocardioides sp. TaxID=198441 RepID=A0A6J4P3V5_9ACTN|nr:MAG: hypothetical protein AVDCRST_MAG60-2324 [uncultured Nocardioides sp.]